MSSLLWSFTRFTSAFRSNPGSGCKFRVQLISAIETNFSLTRKDFFLNSKRHRRQTRVIFSRFLRLVYVRIYRICLWMDIILITKFSLSVRRATVNHCRLVSLAYERVYSPYPIQPFTNHKIPIDHANTISRRRTFHKSSLNKDISAQAIPCPPCNCAPPVPPGPLPR